MMYFDAQISYEPLFVDNQVLGESSIHFKIYFLRWNHKKSRHFNFVFCKMYCKSCTYLYKFLSRAHGKIFLSLFLKIMKSNRNLYFNKRCTKTRKKVDVDFFKLFKLLKAKTEPTLKHVIGGLVSVAY